MRRIIIILAFLSGTWAGRADDRSTAILQKISTTLNGYKNYEVAFSFVVRNSPSDVSSPITGSYVVSGEKYYIDLDMREVYCDGKTKYEVDRENREVTIDKVNPADRSFLANPTQAFDFLDGTFTHRFEEKQSYGGKSCDMIALTAVDKSSGLSDARLYVDCHTGLPASVIYAVGGSSSEIEVTVKKITPLSSVAPKRFIFDRSRYGDFELIDFR